MPQTLPWNPKQVPQFGLRGGKWFRDHSQGEDWGIYKRWVGWGKVAGGAHLT